MSEVLNPSAIARNSLSSHDSHRIRNSPPHRKTRQGANMGPFPATHNRSNASLRSNGGRNCRVPRTASRVFHPAAATNQSVQLYKNRRLRTCSYRHLSPEYPRRQHVTDAQKRNEGLVSCDCPCPRHCRRHLPNHRRCSPNPRCRFHCCQHFPDGELEWIRDTNH